MVGAEAGFNVWGGEAEAGCSEGRGRAKFSGWGGGQTQGFVCEG